MNQKNIKKIWKNKNFNNNNEIIINGKKDSHIQIKKSKSKLFYCEICNKEMKMGSKSNHIKKSEEHKKNLEKSNK